MRLEGDDLLCFANVQGEVVNLTFRTVTMGTDASVGFEAGDIVPLTFYS